MVNLSQSNTYRPEEVITFRRTRERFGGLSNMAPGFPINLCGIRIATSEALYQACRYPYRPDIQRMIVEQRSPMTAKMKARRHLHETRHDWAEVRLEIMRWCLRVKLVQNWSMFGDLLLRTGGVPIVEDSRRDAYWGAKRTDRGLIGTNALGKLLMELRDDLTGNNEHLLRRVDPPQIPDFLLCGQPISSATRGSETRGSRVGEFGGKQIQLDLRFPVEQDA